MDQTLAPPQRWVIRKPSGDPDAARRLATAYDDLADAVDTEIRRATAALVDLTDTWVGVGQRAAGKPEDHLSQDAQAVIHALRAAADDLRAYAQRLQKAHEHHGWSLGRLAAVGAMVVVGTAAIVVTVGAAAPAEAALAAAAVEGAEAAATTAAVSGGSVAANLLSVEGLLAAVRPLASFVVPHLVSAAATTGLEAGMQVVSGEPLDVQSLLVASGEGFMGSGLGGVAATRLESASKMLRRAADVGVFSATAAVGDYAQRGYVDPLDVLGASLTGGIAPEIRAGVDHARLMWRLHVPDLPLGFASRQDWRTFAVTMYGGLDQAGRTKTKALFHGSSVTGKSFETGVPFDEGRLSDYDVALVDAALLAKARSLHIPLRWSGSRTAELWPRSVRRLGLGELRRELSALAGRPVNFMIFEDMETARVRACIEVARP
jgi:uncharacterized protein YukE